MTYYANKYDKLGNIVGPDDNQHIKVYAQRLRDVVEVVKHNTGKNKVIIIAHSMGGLVSRAYIEYYGGINSVDKLVTIGTPNHGIISGENLISPAYGCSIGHPGPECYDMDENNTFIIELNSGDETPGDIKYLTITGKSKKGAVYIKQIIPYYPCGNTEIFHDGVVCSTSAPLDDAENFEYKSPSDDDNLHGNMVYPSKAPEVYNKIINFIKG